MRIAHSLVIVVVLIYSTAVSSTNSEISHEKCSPTSLCNELSNQDELNDNVENEVIQPDQLSCSTCNMLTLVMKEKFDSIKREDMIDRMLHACNGLNILSDTCANFVISYFDDIYEIVKDQLQSNKICASSGICRNNDRQIELESLKSLTQYDEFYCVECKKISKHVHETLIKKITEEQFKNKLKSICNLTNNFKKECLGVVDQYSHTVYNLLKNNMKPESLCLLIGVCHMKKEQDEDFNDFGNDLQLPSESVEDLKSPQCFACKTAFRVVKKLVSRHASNDKVKNAMNHACDKFGKLARKCHDVINRHGDGIIKFIRNPRVLCSMIGMCFPIGQEEIDYEVDDLKNAEQVQIEVYGEDMQLITDALTKDSKNCGFCKSIIQTLQKLVKDNIDIHNALKSVCHVLKNQNQQDKCQDMIGKNTDLIIDLMSKNVAHQAICRSLNMCLLLEEENELIEFDGFRTELQNDNYQLEMPELSIQSVSKAPKCSICKTAMRGLLKVAQHGGKDEIRRALAHVCHKLRKLQQHCEQMVNEHSDQIVDLITKHTPPATICKMIGMCKSATEENFELEEILPEEEDNQIVADVDVDMDITASPKCFVCKSLMKGMQHLIKHKGDKGSIERAMQKACSKMGKLSGKCNRFVQRHGGQIVDLMTKHTGSGRICKMIGVCKNGVSLEDFEMDVNMSEQQSVGSICELRELFVIDEIVEYMQLNNQLEETIDLKSGPFAVICEIMVGRLTASVDTKEKRDLVLKGLLFSCHLWPSIFRDTCTSVVQSFGAGILQMISKIQPHDVCGFLGTNANFTTSEALNFLQDYNQLLDTVCV